MKELIGQKFKHMQVKLENKNLEYDAVHLKVY
jgi:hypothetical protein